MTRYLTLLWLSAAAALAQNDLPSGPAAPVPAPTDSAAAAEDTGIRVRISPTVVSPGRNATLTYNLESTGIPPRIDEYPRIRVDGLEVDYAGTAQRAEMTNGTWRRSLELRYLVMPGGPGEYTIPPQPFRIDGESRMAPGVSFTVSGTAMSLEPVLQLSVGKTEAWRGEPVPVQVTLLVHHTVQPHPPVMPQLLGPDFVFNRFDRAQNLDLTEINGEIWRSMGMESAVTALHAGDLTLGPAEINAEFSIPLSTGGRDQFGRVASARRSIHLVSNTIAMKIRELPTEGRPEGFTGAVGRFDLNVSASPLKLSAGDPVAVEIVVSGTGAFDQIEAPALESEDGWRTYEPRLTQENRGWGTEPGEVAFTQVLIPERNVKEIPPFVLHYFDPQTGQYVTRRSQPIALEIAGSIEPPAADAGSGALDFFAGGSASAPLEESNDILPQPLRDGRWFSATASTAPVSPWLLHGAPAVLLALVLGGGIARRTREFAAARRQRKAEPRRPHAVMDDLRRPGQDRRSFYRLVNEFLASREYYSRPTAGAAPPELDSILRSRDRWLYAGDVEGASGPVPRAEQEQAARVLARLA